MVHLSKQVKMQVLRYSAVQDIFIYYHLKKKVRKSQKLSATLSTSWENTLFFQHQHLKLLLICSSCCFFVISPDKLLTSLPNPLVFIGPVDKDKQQPTEKSSFNCPVRQSEPDPKRIGRAGRASGRRNHDLLTTVLW